MDETSAHSDRRVNFGEYELDLRSGELRKSGARLSLQQQPLRLLSVLLEHPGEIVTRDELRRRLWPDDTFVDFEHGLNAAVKRLRDTLGDSADSPRFIETVPRRGYRFIAPARVPGEPAARTTRASGLGSVRRAWVILAVGVATATTLGIRSFLKGPVPSPAASNVAAASGSLGPVMRLTAGSFLNTESTLSPDGEWVAYASDRGGEGNLDIWVQRLSGGEPLQLTRDGADDREPTFSADGSRIAFRSEREGGGIYVMPAHSGGEAKVLVRGGAHGPRFSPDGRWLAYSTGPGRYSSDKTLPFFSQTYLISSTGGDSTRLLPEFVSVAWPIWSPDGRRLLVTARRELTDDMEWWVVAPGGRAPLKASGITVVAGSSRFAVRPWSWIEGNRIVYSAALGGDSWDLWEVALAPETWTVSAKPKRLTTGSDLQAHASIVRTQLVFSSLTQTINLWTVPLRTNSARVLGPARRITSTSAVQWWPSVSEDGRRLGFRAEKLGTGGLWMRDLDSGNEVLLVSSRTAIRPIIAPDGSRVAYWSRDKPGIYAVPSSGGVPEKICMDCGHSFLFLEDWSNDNTRLLYETGNPTEVFVLDLRSGEKRRVLQRPPNYLWEAQFSPDDRWISVLEVLGSEGRTRIWVVPFREAWSPGAEEWVGVTSGEHWDDKPRWSPDGHVMYFTSLRDGFHCLWAQRLRPETKDPTGPAFVVQHFHSARLSMTNTGFAALGMEVTRDKVFINLGELSGNIWTTHLQR